MPEKKKGRDKKTTLAIAVSCLVLGIPVAGVAIDLESTFMPTPALRNPDVIINAPHIALFAAAFMSIISCIIVLLTTVIFRHISLNNTVVGLAGFAIAGINLPAQLIILALIYITNGANGATRNPNDIRFVDGQYDTQKQFTRESFACTMDNLYLNREPWARNACSEYHYARYTTILMTVMASLLLSIAYWPVRRSLGGRSSAKRVAEGSKA
ncbi:hypothetical protein B0J11DRAFT_112457 [Dendryphion nanum]|uniref:Uncharacterized protein n=1 Tax=Dendryphion nanum TaxID=256645 RepID=A0A9P9DBM3_9PLEO|nr:hypothetical protein B0J11DRAFT_112457 [Dendryphion nanum]